MCIKSNEVPLNIYSDPKKLAPVLEWFKREIFWKVAREKDKLRDQQEHKKKTAENKEQLLKMQT